MAVTTKVKDLVCGMVIDEKTARGTSEFQGEMYHFCSENCLETFNQNPAEYAADAKEEVLPSAVNKAMPAAATGKHDHLSANGAGERVDLPITGMTCAACANRI